MFKSAIRRRRDERSECRGGRRREKFRQTAASDKSRDQTEGTEQPVVRIHQTVKAKKESCSSESFLYEFFYIDM